MVTYKHKEIHASVNKDKTTVKNNGTVFYTEDKNTASLQLFITFNDKPFDLNNTSMTPVLDLFHQDKSIWIDEPLDIIDAKTGVLQYKIPENIIQHAGNVRAKLFLKNTDESVHVANFDFIIKDSGIEGAIEKEISVNLVDDAVRRIVKENAIEILGDGFEQRLNTDVINHLDSNPKLFKGVKGDKGETGAQGVQGLKGDKGDIGLTGKTGEQGPQGVQGPKGDRGEKGFEGEVGPQGPQGETGLNGQDGAKGDKGDKGDIGPKGDKGIDADPNDVIEQIEAINDKISFDSVNLKTVLNSKVPLQSFIYTDKDIYALRVEPAKTRDKEDITLMRFSKSGTYIDSMKLLGTSHIENAGYKDDWFYFVFYSTDGTDKKLIKFKYINNTTVAYETVENGNVVPISLDINSEVDKVNINIYNDVLNMMYYNGDTLGITLKQYNLNSLELLKSQTVATDVNISWLQGCVASTELIYVMIGEYAAGKTKQIRTYNVSDGALSEIKDISNIGSDDVGSLPMNNWLEPEGLQIYQKNGKDILMQGVFTGGSNDSPTQKRYKIYEYNNMINNRSDQLAYLLNSDSMIYDGPSIQGNDTTTKSMIETAKNYKFLTFYYTAGVAGTHTVTVPTDLLKLVKYVDCECDSITANSELYKYITRVTFKEDLKQFSITTSRMLKVDITDLTKSSTTKDNYAGFYLYKIKGHQTYSEFDIN